MVNLTKNFKATGDTTVPIDGTIKTDKKAILGISDVDLPAPMTAFIKLVYLRIIFCSFGFREEEFVQQNEVAMGSPLGGLAACLYMEIIDQEHYIRRMGRGAVWMR